MDFELTSPSAKSPRFLVVNGVRVRRYNHAETSRRWKLKHPERAAASDARYKQANREKLRLADAKRYRESERYRRAMRDSFLKRHYGITLATYENMIAEQNGLCDCCGRPFAMFNKGPAVDHCHSTGRVRGLLCDHCNVVLGRLEKHGVSAHKFEDYLRKHHAASAD